MFLCKDFYAYFVLICFCNAVLKTKPKNTVSLKGKRVEFKCQSDSQNPIDWSFTSVGSNAERQFYFNRTFYFFASLYAVETDETGRCNLIIDSVDFSYAGNYKCTSKTSANEKESYSAELVVLDSNPICTASSVNGSEEYEIIVTECQMNYRGNAKPRMVCTVNDDRAIINSTLTVNYTDYPYPFRHNTTLTNITSSFMTSLITTPKLQNTITTCNITFIAINGGNFEYFYAWTYASNNGSKDNTDGKGNENTDSPPYIMIIIVACVLVTLCVIVLLLLWCKKFCGQQKNRMSHNSEPDVLLPMQLYGECTQYEEVHLQERPGITTEAVASSFDVHGDDVSCDKTGTNAEDGKVKLKSGKKESAKYSVVSKKTTASKTKKKGVVTGADGTVYTEVSVRPDCGRYVQPSDSPRAAIHRVQNYVAVDHTWKCLPAPPKI